MTPAERTAAVLAGQVEGVRIVNNPDRGDVVLTGLFAKSWDAGDLEYWGTTERLDLDDLDNLGEALGGEPFLCWVDGHPVVFTSGEFWDRWEASPAGPNCVASLIDPGKGLTGD